jgi:hypothetical protein
VTRDRRRPVCLNYAPIRLRARRNTLNWKRCTEPEGAPIIERAPDSLRKLNQSRVGDASEFFNIG